jgi:hypothetical protein
MVIMLFLMHSCAMQYLFHILNCCLCENLDVYTCIFLTYLLLGTYMLLACCTCMSFKVGMRFFARIIVDIYIPF